MSEADPMHDETTAVEGQPGDPAPRNPLMLVAAVVAAIALAAGVWFFLVTPLLLGDDAGSPSDPRATPSDDPGSEATSDRSGPDGSGASDADVADELEDLPLVTFEVFLARDPFEPVIPEPVSTLDATNSADGGEPPAPTDGSDGETATTNDDPRTPPGAGEPVPVTPPPSGTEPEGDGTETTDGRILRLVEITTDDGARVAVVQVDSTLFEVREGDRFAGNLVVQSIGSAEVVILYGDDVFRLRDGDRVLK